ncbi:hypothetical protein [Dyadobacter sediminis]|uniref:Uncharacterized protein n=1 Tax=Dyadobacter sediminis TaxID=1493691 RepID=A0A5R9K7T5_9BACT|nr:hypothetical protein [Dyadobacter sediminis]TLU89966.1 hypothetical protein FEM55_20810 [Dyadobacter sediminis]
MNFIRLRTCSIIYLSIPNLIFSWAWFRWEVALVMTVCYALLVKHTLFDNEEASPLTTRTGDIIFILCYSFIWTSVMGVGGFFSQTLDFVGHNTKHYDLFKSTWPIIFNEVNQYACYYFGYYLFPALISKMLGTFSVAVIFIWSWTGMALGTFWVYMIIEKNKFLMLVFPFVWTITFIIPKFLAWLIPVFPDTYYFEWMWGLFNQSLWVVNQIIPSLIVAGLILYSTSYEKSPLKSFFPVILCFIWAVFPAVIFGLIAFLIAITSRYSRFSTANILNHIILPGIIFIPVGLYLTSSDGLPVKGFMWEFYSLATIIEQFSAGIIFEIVVLAALSFLLFKYSNRFSGSLLVCVYIAVIPLLLYKIGFANDFQTRGILPIGIMGAIIFLHLVSKAMAQLKLANFNFYYCLAFFMCLSFYKPQGVDSKLLQNKLMSRLFPGRFEAHVYEYDTYSNTYQMLLQEYSNKEAKQYLGRKNSVYERFLMRKAMVSQNN